MKRYLPLLLLTFCSSSAYAVPFTEIDDAGELLSSAQETVGSGSLTSINASLINLADSVANTIDDIDLYKIFISDTDVFSATFAADPNGIDDAWLYLFNSNGEEVAFNDDRDPGVDFLPQFDAGVISGLASAHYYLGVGLYGTEASFTSGSLSSWTRDPDPFQSGGYTLSLTGTQFSSSPVPAPAPLALLALGLLGIGLSKRRKTI